MLPASAAPAADRAACCRRAPLAAPAGPGPVVQGGTRGGLHGRWLLASAGRGCGPRGPALCPVNFRCLPPGAERGSSAFSAACRWRRRVTWGPRPAAPRRALHHLPCAHHAHDLPRPPASARVNSENQALTAQTWSADYRGQFGRHAPGRGARGAAAARCVARGRRVGRPAAGQLPAAPAQGRAQDHMSTASSARARCASTRAGPPPTPAWPLGDEVRVPPVRLPEPAAAPPAPAREFPVLFEDEHLLAIDKPAGVAVHGGSGVSFGVIEQLRSSRGRRRASWNWCTGSTRRPRACCCWPRSAAR
jgi:hypothetical protein